MQLVSVSKKKRLSFNQESEKKEAHLRDGCNAEWVIENNEPRYRLFFLMFFSGIAAKPSM